MINSTPEQDAARMSGDTINALQQIYSARIAEVRGLETRERALRTELEDLTEQITCKRRSLEEIRPLLVVAEGDAVIRPEATAEALAERAYTLRALTPHMIALANHLDAAARARKQQPPETLPAEAEPAQEVPVVGRAGPYPPETAPMPVAGQAPPPVTTMVDGPAVPGEQAEGGADR